jgi:hypothetical protein
MLVLEESAVFSFAAYAFLSAGMVIHTDWITRTLCSG